MVPILHCLLLLWLGWWGSAGRAQENTTTIVEATESHTVFLPCPFEHTLTSSSLTWNSPSGDSVIYVNAEYYNSKARLGDAWGLLYNPSREENTMLTCTLNGVSGTNYMTQNRTDSAWPVFLSQKWWTSTLQDLKLDVIIRALLNSPQDENPKEHEYYGNDTDGAAAAADSDTLQEEVEDSEGDDDSTSGDLEELAQTEVGLKLFPCDAPTSSNWTEGSLHWIRHNLMSREETVLMNITIRRSSRFGLSMRSNAIFLIIPSVTSKDAGTYTCQGKNQKHSFQLEVTAKSNWILGDQHWIIWTVALGCTVVCVSSVLCFWWLKRVAHAHKKQLKKRIPGGRYFYAKRKKGHVSNGLPLPPAKQDATDDFSYENVIQDMGPRSGRQLLQKGKILPNHVNMEDEEEYENPDSETELKSDDGDNYENTQEEMKQEDVILNDVSFYENNTRKTEHGSHKSNSADQLYENKTQEGPKILTQDLLDEDGENYENLENETSFSSGAARLIAGLRLQLDLDPQVDKQDGSSEASTGSQSYEEMNGSLSPSAMKSLLHPNTSNEEDGDSYENMESPNNFISRKEGNVDRSAEDGVFNSTWPNLSSPPAPNHKGGLLCSD